MRKILFYIITIFFAAVLVVSCKNDRFKVNTRGIEPGVKIKRLEMDLFSSDPGSVMDKAPVFKAQYGTFLQLFSYVINTGDINDPGWPAYLSAFCTDKINNEVYVKTMEVFPEISEIESGLNEAMKRYLFYFPGRSVPLFYSNITGFNNSIIVGDSVLGIGLDMYLGADCTYYPKLGFYDYQSARMTPLHIVPDCMYAWASTEWNYEEMSYDTKNTLSAMIHEGKLLYFVKCMIPDTEENLLFGFSEDQMKFCINNEGMMWQYLVEHDLLFDTDQFSVNKLVGEAPFTSYFTSQSPGKAGVWLGFRIVESFMAKNPGTKLEDLLNNTSFQTILEESMYSPK